MQDSYRPGRPDRDRDRDRDRPPPLAERMTFPNGGGDNYRPGQSDFTFESSHAAPRFPPSGPANSGSRAPPKGPRGGRRGGRGDRGGRNNANGRGRGAPYKKHAPHERALLRHRDNGSPEVSYGVDGPSRFMNLDDMSDDAEADMDESDVSASGNDGHGDSKVARTHAPRADGNSVPKWSNPDPYTSLPPPSETTGVKKDVVQLIRKAKNQDVEKAVGNNAVAANDDFISFADDDDDEEEDDGEIDDAPGLHIYEDEEPICGRGRRRDTSRGGSRRPAEGSMNDVAYINDMLVVPAQPIRGSYQPQSGGRKRRHNGEVAIVDEWVATSRGSHRTPWAERPETYDHLRDKPDRWLHNEILDFYDWVAPQSYEHQARHKLVQRVNSALGSQKWFPQDAGTVLSFGSFPAGLYLPTADMDLVYTSERHYRGGPPVFDPAYDKQVIKKTLFKASRRLQMVGIANHPQVIAGAKVPIIKFKDRLTGLDVDVSFENLSGVQAQATFQQWKDSHPDLVYMVALIKQLLVMRGLNEVHSGGLGGFSIICLIVNYLELNEKPENLGECFLGFLKHYGKTFDISRKRIQMAPPAIVEKSMYGIDGRLEKDDGLSIQDPNRPENNISGGSHKAVNAFKVFADAYDTLMDRMDAVKLGNFDGSSLLGCILGGNYESYIIQRRHMKSLT